MKITAVIPAAGTGKRFCGRIPKQYTKIDGIPVLAASLSAFNSAGFIDNIILVPCAGRLEYAKRLVKRYGLSKVTSVVPGGRTRAHSVYNGLAAAPSGTDIVVVHDGVRPAVEKTLIKKVISAAVKYGAAVSAVKPKPTIKIISAGNIVESTLDRNRLVEVQTPQAFRYGILMDAYEKFKDRLSCVTDDSSLVEMAGHRVKIVQGSYANVKITTKGDIKYITGNSRKLRPPSSAYRVGVGYDIHRLTAGRKFILGGVEIKSRKGLAGHSDADVLLHSITDALFGAVSGRDIGWHFPCTAPVYKDMPSMRFLIKAKDEAEKKGYRILNIDSVVAAERPMLSPYYRDIVKNISGRLRMDSRDITVKFTTSEGLGPLGHREAVCAISAAGLVKIL